MATLYSWKLAAKSRYDLCIILRRRYLPQSVRNSLSDNVRVRHCFLPAIPLPLFCHCDSISVFHCFDFHLVFGIARFRKSKAGFFRGEAARPCKAWAFRVQIPALHKGCLNRNSTASAVGLAISHERRVPCFDFTAIKCGMIRAQERRTPRGKEPTRIAVSRSGLA